MREGLMGRFRRTVKKGTPVNHRAKTIGPSDPTEHSFTFSSKVQRVIVVRLPKAHANPPILGFFFNLF